MGKPTEAVSPKYCVAHRESGTVAILPDNSFVTVRLTCNHREGDESGHIGDPSMPDNDGVGDPHQHASTSDARSIANACQGDRDSELGQVISDALVGPLPTGSSRKRDHDTMTDAARPADDSGAASDTPSCSNNPAHDGRNPFLPDSLQTILPKSPGSVLSEPAETRQPNIQRAILGRHATHGANQQLKEATVVLPYLFDDLLPWLPAPLQVAAKNGGGLVEKMITHVDDWIKERLGNPIAIQVGIAKKADIVKQWHTTLRALAEVATAARDGRLLYNLPLLRNQITAKLEIQVPDPDQLVRLHDNNQYILGLPSLPEYKQQDQHTSPPPIIMGMSLSDNRSVKIAQISQEIVRVMRMSAEDERERQKLNAPIIKDFDEMQPEKQTQALEMLQTARRMADELRELEAELIADMIKTRSELVNEMDG